MTTVNTEARDRSRRRRTTSAVEAQGRSQILDAAVACILELGFYRASSNEIARRAGVSWGSIQYHFGSREALMLAVVEEWNERFGSSIRRARIKGDTLEARLGSLYAYLAKQYGGPRFLARMQIVLNLSHDPDTSADVEASLAQQEATTADDIRRLFRDAIGEDASEQTIRAVFHAIRGTALSRQLSDAIPMPSSRRGKASAAQELAMFVDGLAAMVRGAHAANR